MGVSCVSTSLKTNRDAFNLLDSCAQSGYTKISPWVFLKGFPVWEYFEGQQRNYVELHVIRVGLQS